MEIITKTKKRCSWGRLKIAADKGELATIIKSGDQIPIKFKNGESAVLDVTRDENGNFFFVMANTMKEERSMNEKGTVAGGWNTCDMRKYLNEKIFKQLPKELQSVIATTKIVQVINGKRIVSEDKLFLLSATQVFGKGYWSENEQGDSRLDCFRYEQNRIKHQFDEHKTWWMYFDWWLRSVAENESHFYYTGNNGYYYTGPAIRSFGVVFAFRI